jgi:hypothetical protein
MKIFRFAILFCVLMGAMAAFAHQGSTQQPGQMPQTPGATSQTPSGQNPQYPGATPPYTAPQTQPGSAQTPGAQGPQGEPSQAPPTRSSAPSVDDQVNSLTSQLNLNSDQQAKVKTILEDQHQQVVDLVNDKSMSQDAKLQKVHAIRQQTIDKVRGTLTSDEQKSKFDTMIQTSNERLRQREQQGQQQNNPPAPK